MYGLKRDWEFEQRIRSFVIEDYEGATPRWCSGCGDNTVLTAVHRLCRDEQLPPEKTVVVSGIGCSSRFPHYMKTYGFHSLHGRALPVASGVRARRPDLNIFVATGDGDCCAIGTAHWIHAVRYNMKMVVMLLDNGIYGLTKKQSSPTTPKGLTSNTHPEGTVLSPLNPLSVVLGITNVSFVAQTVDWNPAHVYATLQAAHRHPGFAFVRILQRCPHFMPGLWDPIQNDPTKLVALTHADGLPLDPALSRVFKNQAAHDPSDLMAAHRWATGQDGIPIGLLYKDTNAERYDLATVKGADMPPATRKQAVEAELDRFLI